MTQSDRLAFLVKTDMEGELFLGGGGGAGLGGKCRRMNHASCIHSPSDVAAALQLMGEFLTWCIV